MTDDEKITFTILEELQEKSPGLYRLAELMSKISGKVSVLEAFCTIVGSLRANKGGPEYPDALVELVNQYFMLEKLTNNDVIKHFETEKRDQARAAIEQKRKQEEEDLRRAREEYDRLRRQDHWPKRPSQISRISWDYVRRNPKNLNERLVDLIDHINDGNFDDFESRREDLDYLKNWFNVETKAKGWFAKYYEFTDKAVAAKARAELLNHPTMRGKQSKY